MSSSVETRKHTHPLLLVLIAISIGAIAQILLKKGMTGIILLGPASLIAAVFTPYVFVGLALYAFSTLFWLKVLSTQELSYVYPMIAVSYVIVAVLSAFFLHEKISLMRGLSLAVICAGVAMLATLGANKTSKAHSPHSEVASQGQVTSAQNPQTGSSEAAQ